MEVTALSTVAQPLPNLLKNDKKIRVYNNGLKMLICLSSVARSFTIFKDIWSQWWFGVKMLLFMTFVVDDVTLAISVRTTTSTWRQSHLEKICPSLLLSSVFQLASRSRVRLSKATNLKKTTTLATRTRTRRRRWPRFRRRTSLSLSPRRRSKRTRSLGRCRFAEKLKYRFKAHSH